MSALPLSHQGPNIFVLSLALDFAAHNRLRQNLSKVTPFDGTISLYLDTMYRAMPVSGFNDRSLTQHRNALTITQLCISELVF